MNIFKRYLERRKQENERREQEAFLNSKISISKLFICRLYICYEKYDDMFLGDKYRFQCYKILKKINNSYQADYNYIDPITKNKYKCADNIYISEGDIVVRDANLGNFSVEIQTKQYIKISELIELNEELNNK